MITMEVIGRIRRMHARGKKSEREISRSTGLSRNTVAKWLREPVEGAPKYERMGRATKLTPCHEVLKQALAADAHRAKRERRTARALYAEIKAAGYEGGYTRVTDFIREWRRAEGQGVLSNAFVPLAFELVVNVLSRLNATKAPESAQTTLQASTPPLADTARYDRLRGPGDACIDDMQHDDTHSGAQEPGHA